MSKIFHVHLVLFLHYYRNFFGFMKKQFCIVILLLSNSIAHLLKSVLVTVLGVKEAVVLVFSPASLTVFAPINTFSTLSPLSYF